METNTKLNPFVRIKGDAQRGKEVISELEKRGGVNICDRTGDDPNLWYFITETGNISNLPHPEVVSDFFLANYEEVKLPRWRAKDGEKYWYLGMVETGGYHPLLTTDKGYPIDDNYWKSHNYFPSESEAQAKADAINAILQGDNKL